MPEKRDVCSAEADHSVECVCEHLRRNRTDGDQRLTAWAVDEAGEQGHAVRATLGRVSPLLTLLRGSQASAEKPQTELKDKIKLGVHRAPDCGMVSFALAVVLPARDMHGSSAGESRNAVACVKVKPKVAHLEGYKFGHPKAAESGESHH
jgi:hypothetical protein